MHPILGLISDLAKISDSGEIDFIQFVSIPDLFQNNVDP